MILGLLLSSVASSVQIGAPPPPGLDISTIFGVGDLGDVWEFNPDTTDATLHGDPITTATGLANGLVLTNPATAPTLEDNAGFWAARFGASTARLAHTFATPLPQPGTVVLVMEDYGVAFTSIVYVTGPTATARWQISNNSTGLLTQFAGLVVTPREFPPFGKRIMEAEFNGASSAFRLDNALAKTGNAGAYPADGIVIGTYLDGSLQANSSIYGVLIIDRLLTDVEKALIDTWGNALMNRLRPVGMPDSVINMVLPSSFTFTGGVLSDVTPVFGHPDIEITGSLPEGVEGGFAVTEANIAGNYMRLTYSQFDAPSGVHYILAYRRSAVADTQCILMGTTSTSGYTGIAIEGSTDTLTASETSLDRYRIGGVDYLSGVVTRGGLWTAAMTGTETKCVAFKDLNFPTCDARLFRFASGTAYGGELECFGWAQFTDWTQVDEIVAYMQANMPV